MREQGGAKEEESSDLLLHETRLESSRGICHHEHGLAYTYLSPSIVKGRGKKKKTSTVRSKRSRVRPESCGHSPATCPGLSGRAQPIPVLGASVHPDMCRDRQAHDMAEKLQKLTEDTGLC